MRVRSPAIFELFAKPWINPGSASLFVIVLVLLLVLDSALLSITSTSRFGRLKALSVSKGTSTSRGRGELSR
jgi:hypothetical protein